MSPSQRRALVALGLRVTIVLHGLRCRAAAHRSQDSRGGAAYAPGFVGFACGPVRDALRHEGRDGGGARRSFELVAAAGVGLRPTDRLIRQREA